MEIVHFAEKLQQQPLRLTPILEHYLYKSKQITCLQIMEVIHKLIFQGSRLSLPYKEKKHLSELWIFSFPRLALEKTWASGCSTNQWSPPSIDCLGSSISSSVGSGKSLLPLYLYKGQVLPFPNSRNTMRECAKLTTKGKPRNLI